MEGVQKVFIITTASTFLHSYELYGNPQFEYAKRSTLYLARDGEKDYWIKTPLLNFKFHPNYLLHPGLYGGYDIAVASFDITKAKSFIKDLDTFKNMLSRITPTLPTEFKINPGEELFITGYPADCDGCLHQQKAKVFDQLNIENGISKLLIFKDLEQTKGMAGAPVMSISESGVGLMGIYVGQDET